MPDSEFTPTEIPTSTEGLLRYLALRAGGSGLPYGADKYVVTYYGTTNNVHTITYYKGVTALKVRTLTYAGSGAADNDKLLQSVDA